MDYLTTNNLDTIVIQSTDVQIQSSVSPEPDIPLPKRLSLTSLRGKISYKINNDLAQVHRSSNMNKIEGDNSKNEYTYSFRSVPNNFDNISIKSIDSDFKISLDRLETSSITSDIPNSVSSISDLTGYEEEFLQIKKFIHNNNCINTSEPKHKNKYKNDVFVYKTRIEQLESQLQNSREENEKYKFDLRDLETKVQLIWHEKYQDLLRKKAQSEGQLDFVRKQLENSLKEKENLRNCLKTDQIQSENINLHYKLKQFAIQNTDLSSKLDLVQNESKQWHIECQNSEQENEKLRISIQELKSELDSKTTIQLGLKNKITEQHIEIQGHVQANLELNNQMTTLKNEINSVKKQQKWYMEQLHSCQLVKSNMQQELMSNKTNLIAATHKLENLKLETEKWKNSCEESQLKAIREKGDYIKKFEVLEADFLERETILKCTKTSTIEQNYCKPKIESNDYNNIIQDYEDELKNMKKLITDQTNTIKNIQVQNTDYIVRLTTLQKNLNESEIQVQTLQDLNRDLEQKLNIFSENSHLKDAELLDLKNKIVNLEVGLHGANREKQEIDDVVQRLRHDFNKFMKCYNLMKEKVEEKTRIIAQFEQEKQELFMENNWKICEIETLQQKVLDRKGLQAEIVEITNVYNQVMIEKENLVQATAELKQQNVDLHLKLNTLEEHLKKCQQLQMIEEQSNCSKDVSNLENEILKLNEVLIIRENQLENQTKNVELLHNDLELKEMTITSLEEKCLNLDFQQEKIEDLTKKLVDANCVVDQFNNLCRNSEIEKNNLSLELQTLKQNKCAIFLNKEIQTDNHVNSIKLLDNNIKQSDKLVDINEYSETIPNLNIKQFEINENNNKIVRQTIEAKIKILNARCRKLDNNYDLISKVIDLVPKPFKPNLKFKTIEIQTHFEVNNDELSSLMQETKDLKTLLRVNETERKEQYKRFETNNRTLLKKVKEHMRGRKSAEKQLFELNVSYKFAVSELNNLKLNNKRLDIELQTFKFRCEEYKLICDKLNKDIVALENEKIYQTPNECLNCLDKESILNNFVDLESKYSLNEQKLLNYDQQIQNANRELMDLKKMYFNEKLKLSAMQKQVSSYQMCLENANVQLDNKKIEFSGLKALEEKLKLTVKELEGQLDHTAKNHQECKQKLDETNRILEETNAKDDILADEIKTLSCHLHQKSLDISNLQNQFTILESKSVLQATNYENTIKDLQQSLSEAQMELTTIRNDKFFLQRLCADLKMSLQGTVNQNNVLKHRLEVLETNVSLENIAFLSKIDEDHINNLLQQSTMSPDKPLKNLRSCLDSLKQEMVSLQKEIHIKTQIDFI